MAETKLAFMDADTFLDWCTRQEERYELVDGLVRMMTGSRKAHDRVVSRGLSSLARRLSDRRCEAFSEAIAVRIPSGNIRRPDIVVDCGKDDPDLTVADKPVLVIEVLSPSTRQLDLVRKVAEYQSVPSILHILLLEADEPTGLLHTREAGAAWSTLTLIGAETEIPLTALGITLPLSDLYE